MQLTSCILLLACLAGPAFAATSRQIPSNASPPPPASIATVPGTLFSVVVPGYTSLSWNSTLSTTLCNGLKARTSGYPTANLDCVVNAVTTTSTPNINSIAASGWMIWQAFPGMTTSQQTDAVNSRDLFISNVRAAPSALNVGIANANLNDTCDSSFISTTGATASDAVVVAGWNTQARCRTAPLGLTVPEPTLFATEDLRFTSVTATTINTVGVDNGKTCSFGSPFITPAAPVTSLATAGAGAGAAVSCVSTTGVCTVTLNANPGSTAAAVPVGTGIILPPVTATGCAAGDLPSIISSLAQVQIVTGGTATGNGGGATLTFLLNGATSFTCTGGGNPTITSATNTVAGAWSPSCDTNFAFYAANSPGGLTGTAAATSVLGYICPSCASGTTKNLFTYNGANAGKFCTSTAGTSMLSNTLSNYVIAGRQGTSCVGPVGVANLGAGNADTGKPMLMSSTGGVAISAIFPSAATNPAGANPASGIVAHSATTGAMNGVAVDTEFGLPCSFPALSLSNSPSLGVTSNKALPTETGLNVGYGTCNTQSRFWNGGSATNGIATAAYGAALVPATFTASIVAFPPPPAVVPAPAPTPAKAPSPAPTPSPTPAPSPAPAITCTYTGVYTIESVACTGKFIAYTNDPNTGACKNSTIMLRTAQQSKSPRNHWALNASAVSGTTPTASSQIASGRAGKCTNDKYTNLAAANSSPTPRLAGSGWKNRIIPVDAAKGCDTVWIQAVGDNPYAGKYLGYGSCSSQTAFKWEAASSSSALQWKLTKA